MWGKCVHRTPTYHLASFDVGELFPAHVHRHKGIEVDISLNANLIGFLLGWLHNGISFAEFAIKVPGKNPRTLAPPAVVRKLSLLTAGCPTVRNQNCARFEAGAAIFQRIRAKNASGHGRQNSGALVLKVVPRKPCQQDSRMTLTLLHLRLQGLQPCFALPSCLVASSLQTLAPCGQVRKCDPAEL